MKFGKQIQRQQLDLPEYASSFLNYKALKKLIKQLSATPTIPAQGAPTPEDAQAALRANRQVFFFSLEREISKVNTFYLQKEAEFSLRLKTLLDKKRVIQARASANSRVSASFATLVEGFQQFDNDLNKLQQFVEVNETAISKILKKWDKTSKSRTKELYLQRAVEIQPCFNRDVLRDLSDRATTARQDLEAWAEGENIQYISAGSSERTIGQRIGTEESDADLQISQAAAAGNFTTLREWVSRLGNSADARERFTRIFLSSVSEAPRESIEALIQSNLVDIHAEDDMNERNCLHEATIYGNEFVLDLALSQNVDVTRLDVYGRSPLHYASMRGRLAMVEKLIAAGPSMIDLRDHDNFSPLILSIVRDKIECVRLLLSQHASIDPASENDHIPLNLACQHSLPEIVKLLLELNAQLLPDAEGLYPQHLVARSSKDPGLLLLLKQHDADLNQRDKLYAWTPLFHAASEGNVACLQALLENGADAAAIDEKGLTATYYATWEGHLECMDLLWDKVVQPKPQPRFTTASTMTFPSSTAMDASPPLAAEVDGIPDLYLPPPIIPLRRYGHNFLDTKTLISINFDKGSKAIKFFNEGRYPAARITISSKMSDLIPRNIMLPIQEDARVASFQIDNLDSFAVDFEIFPTFGSKVIAKSVALSDVFKAVDNSAGVCTLPLFDPRLRSIGQIQFCYQVVKPYSGTPLEITQFATYWKATSSSDDSGALITGLSLSGDYLRLCVQMTRDGFPIIASSYLKTHYGLDVSISQRRLEELSTLGAINLASSDPPSLAEAEDIHYWRGKLNKSIAMLQDVLATVPAGIHLNLHILYPTKAEEQALCNYQTIDINRFADTILTEVFNHARNLRAQNADLTRSIVFSSWNPSICTAINWKQPNYPVFLCNDLGGSKYHNEVMNITSSSTPPVVPSCSIKESARLAQSNNFMGLMCSSRILQSVPALVDTIKQAGLVIVSDMSDQDGSDTGKASTGGAGTEGYMSMPGGVNGVMKLNGILRFNESIDM
ncbi:phosphate system positive regulatory protein pho81 [Exophiala xenobiotica]|uniref:Phosphate system positive regulatory protein pho81 n=1 Tax=Lithohypha guttulata TaxID=1690604 RepID=A0ABR0KEC8_9EURO|nr:phosphate system positive regulatory protein pho81 [Lithohypha guttulata]KAK5321586.1 phosphate system positive regulatory protein pho81 [Exophiala xenobiotica]